MKLLLTILAMSMTTNLLAVADVKLFDPLRVVRVFGTPVAIGGSVIFAEVQDNGQSCVYSLKDTTMSFGAISGKISMAYVGQRIDEGTKVSLETDQSVAIDDVIDALESQLDNSGKYRGVFASTPEVLSGEYALFQGGFYVPLTVYALGFYRKIKISTSKNEYLLQAAQKTHSQGSVSCATQPQQF